MIESPRINGTPFVRYSVTYMELRSIINKYRDGHSIDNIAQGMRIEVHRVQHQIQKHVTHFDKAARQKVLKQQKEGGI